MAGGSSPVILKPYVQFYLTQIVRYNLGSMWDVRHFHMLVCLDTVSRLAAPAS